MVQMAEKKKSENKSSFVPVETRKRWILWLFLLLCKNLERESVFP